MCTLELRGTEEGEIAMAGPKRTSDSVLVTTGTGTSVVIQAPTAEAWTVAKKDIEARAFIAAPPEPKKTQPVETSKLQKEIVHLMNSIEGILNAVSDNVGAYGLETILVSAEITADGKISILGSGGGVSATGGIQFTFTKKR